MTEDRRSQRIAFLEQSDIRRMSEECARLDGLNLGQGICPLPSPPEVLDGAAEAIQEDLSTYSSFRGAEPLRAAISDKLADYNGLEVDPDEVVVTIGATGAFASAMQGLFDPGDEVAMFEPYYGYHVNAARGAGLGCSFIPLEPPSWEITRSAIEDGLTDESRAIVVNTPVNPSGKVMTRDELEIVARVCREHDLIAITDEIYEYFLYGDQDHISLATLPGMAERTVTISGFSKTFAITGWRLGYAAGPPSLIEPVGLVNDLHYVCAPTPLQHGVARAMERLSDDYYTQMAEDFEARRDFFCEALEAAGLHPHWPEGAYYVLADVRSLGEATSREAAMTILREAGVASVPGSAFFDTSVGEDLVRFCYAQPRDVLRQAAGQLTDTFG
jgi:aminotransferase